MACSVAVASSPVFSPSRVSSSMFCKSSASSPETLTRTTSSPSPSSPSSSPFRLQFPKSLSGLRSCSDAASCSPTASGSSSSPTILKRKRPGKLDIPIASLGFGVLPTPLAGERREVVEDERDGYAVCCKRGRRAAMEDRYSAVVDLQGDQKQAFYGIFDGHGGAKAAEFAAENLDKNILDEILIREEDEIEEAVKQGYLNTDSEFLKEDFRGGSCCVTALIRKGNLVVSNAGDCRAVMSRGGVAEALTSDHRPSREDEKRRIESLGGYVDFCHGIWRIQGSLAVSRGIGDRHLKQWVTAEPETKIFRIKPEHEFLILASDGLWDKISNQEAVDTVGSLCSSGVDKPESLLACKKLIDLSVSRGSADDISVMLIHLGRYI